MTGPTRVDARLTAVTPIGAGVLALDFDLAGQRATFLPGQYLAVVTEDGSEVPFSIASTPAELPGLTLHYRPTPDSDDARRMDALVAKARRAPVEVALSLPLGECGVAAPTQRPLLLVAGGTGISQAWSVARALAPLTTEAIRLYWGARSADDLYLRRGFDELAAACARFTWVGISEAPAADLRSGLTADVVAADAAAGIIDLATSDVLLCGGPPMVWATVERLRDAGLTADNCRADVFDYAPRDDLWHP